ncbi:hypothetical protein SFA35_07630 [Pseudomonas sp. HR96]|uniref:hypothetical protein n=1 Tax=Pseudomonas sp. HR96 TaxID=1027966 RepID=UPI002A762061|nr:hypothetical protein [Pseudomonas sp. HR96]WPP01221.1 hypothetical protein SFA35_07630 [Pseudomonas sp. HR96]
MSRRMSLTLLSLLLLAAWLAASYGVRYGLMENTRWVGACLEDAAQWQCQVRSGLGLMIHFGVIGWGGIALAVAGFFWPGRVGRVLAALALIPGIVALVLYTASLAVFVVVLAGLRLVRAG